MKNTLLITFLSAFISTSIFAAEEELLFSPKGVAEVHITLHDGLTLNDITREKDVKAQMEIRNSESSTYDGTELYKGEILIKGRGNSSWAGEGYNKEPDIPIIEPFKHKRSYSIDLVDEKGEDNPAPVLGMPSHEKWAIITFYSDKSLMRIPLAYYLGSKMSGLNYSPRIRYVEVFVNGEYRGLYGFCEKVERDKNRVDIKKLTADPADQVEPRISGGYIIETTPYDRIRPDDKSFKSSRGIDFTFKYPKSKNVTDAQIKWIKDYINEFEKALYGGYYKDAERGYQNYINENSFIDWYILQELGKSIDAGMYASVYVQKDRNGKLVMSPPWDFDISFGNINYQECFNEDELRLRKANWFNRLFQDERFAQKVLDRYDELMPLFNQIPTIIEANRKFLGNTGCVERNFEKYPRLGLYDWPNYAPYPTSHKGEVRRLTEWIESRKTWLYINMGITKEDRCERLKNSQPTIRIMEPEAFENGETSNAKVMKGYTYIWTYDGKETKVSNLNYSLRKDGEYRVQIQDGNGCISKYSNPVVKGGETSVMLPIRQKDISIYPNPVKKQMIVNYMADNNFKLKIQVFDTNGKSIKQQQNEIRIGSNRFEMDFSDLADGNYLVQFIGDSKPITRKIIVSH